VVRHIEQEEEQRVVVQTASGPIPMERLGRTLMHEHLDTCQRQGRASDYEHKFVIFKDFYVLAERVETDLGGQPLTDSERREAEGLVNLADLLAGSPRRADQQ
jgi:predicted metal-dependent phosphotriesterase family hydrolase